MVATGRPFRIDDPVREQQCAALFLGERDEAGGLDHHRAARPLRPAGHVERMQAVDVGRTGFACRGNGIERARRRIDYRSSNNAQFGSDHRAVHISHGNGAHAVRGVQEVHLPQRRRIRTRAVGVEGVDAIVSRGQENHVVETLAGHVDARQIERLRVNVAVHQVRKPPPEKPGLNRGGREQCLGEVLASACVIVVVGGYVCLREERCDASEEENSSWSCHLSVMNTYDVISSRKSAWRVI